MLYKPGFNCKNSNELQVSNKSLEVLPIEITIGRRKIFFLGLYRPPSYSENDFLFHLENALSHYNTTYVLVADQATKTQKLIYLIVKQY